MYSNSMIFFKTLDFSLSYLPIVKQNELMLLTITTTHQPATDLGYLLHKHPDKLQSIDLSTGKADI